MSAGGPISLTANDASQIDALAFGVAVGGGAAGMAVATNVIANTIEANIEDSTVQTSSTLSQTAESSSVIRTLVIGASAGGFGLSVTVVGNLVTNTVEATITGSTVTAAGTVTLSAEDIAPSTIPSWIMPSSDQSDYNSGTSNSPVSLSSANILALVINVAGAGDVAANGDGPRQQDSEHGGNRDNLIDGQGRGRKQRDCNQHRRRYHPHNPDRMIPSSPLSAGFAAAGVGAVSANIMGNQIANTVTATMTGSTVEAGSERGPLRFGYVGHNGRRPRLCPRQAASRHRGRGE